MAMLRRGLAGEPVRILQEHLGITADGVFGAGTDAALREYQANNGLSVDGIAGPDTFTSMGLQELVLLHKPIRGEMVRRLQEALGIGADGVFGSGTEAAVRAFQEEQGLEATGEAGPETLARLPGFDEYVEKVEASLVTDNTPIVEEAALQTAQEEAPPEHDPSFVDRAASAAHAAEEAVSNVGKSIWSTVKSIF